MNLGVSLNLLFLVQKFYEVHAHFYPLNPCPIYVLIRNWILVISLRSSLAFEHVVSAYAPIMS